MLGRDESGNDKCPADMGCFAYEAPPKPTVVRTFALDTFEVTVGRFRRFVDGYVQWRESRQPAHDVGWELAWDAYLPSGRATLVDGLGCDPNGTEARNRTWTDLPGANEDKPIVCVDWYEALAFCAWDGGWLPTESEWEYAAAGGNEERLFPWGGQIPRDCMRANFDIIGGGEGCDDRIDPVGAHPSGAGRWAHQDLAGNVFEWVVTAPWGDAQYAFKSALKGGAFVDQANMLRATSRLYDPPSSRRASSGFRCARTP